MLVSKSNLQSEIIDQGVDMLQIMSKNYSVVHSESFFALIEDFQFYLI